MTRLHSYARTQTLASVLRTATTRVRRPVTYILPSLANQDLLLDALAGEQGWFGSTPEIWSWDAIYRAVTPPALLRRSVDPPDNRLILSHVTASVIARLDEEGAAVPSGARRSGFIDVLARAVRELLLEDVQSALPPGGEEGALTPALLLSLIYDEYRDYLAANGLADNAQLPSLAADHCLVSCGKLEERVLFWTGFLSFTGAQLKLLRALERQGVEMEFFVPDPQLPGFYDAASQLGFEGRQAPDGGGRIVTLMARDSYDQYDRLAREISLARSGSGVLRSVLGSGGGEAAASLSDIGILCGSDELPLMAGALSRYLIASESRAERPVSDTPLVRIARSAWDAYMSDWPARRTTHLLSQPIFGLDFDPALLTPRLPEGWQEWRWALIGNRAAISLLERFRSFGDYIAAPEGRTASELLEALLNLAGDDEWEAMVSAQVGDDSSLDGSVREVASARLEARAKLERLNELKNSIGVAGEARFSGHEAMTFITDWGQDATTALQQPRVGAVSLYDSPPPVLVSHRIWIMTDVTPGRYPGAGGQDSLLTAETREGLNAALQEEEGAAAAHLPTQHEKRQAQEALFRRLAFIGQDVTVMARALYDSSGRPQGDSPFLISLLDGGCGWSKAGEVEGSDSSLPGPGEPLLWPGEVSRSSPWRDRSPFPRAASLPRRETPQRVPLSALDRVMLCPFRYWCERMKLEPPQDTSQAFSPLERGNMLHDVWQRVWEAKNEGDPRSIGIIAADVWRSMIKRMEQDPISASLCRAAPALDAMRRNVGRVARLMEALEERAAALGLQREATELEFPMQPLALENALFTGRADRLDRWSNGISVVIDYKLGKSTTYTKSLQAAAYALLLANAGDPISGFGFIGHEDGRLTGRWSQETAPLYNPDSRSRESESFDEAVERAAAAMAEVDGLLGGERFEALYDSELCDRCQYRVICRRDEQRGLWEGETEDVGL